MRTPSTAVRTGQCDREVLFKRLAESPAEFWATEYRRIMAVSPALSVIIEAMVETWSVEMKATLAAGLALVARLPTVWRLKVSRITDEESDFESRHMDSDVVTNMIFVLNRILDNKTEVRIVDLAFGRLHRIIRCNT